jgi:hypothetical protein
MADEKLLYLVLSVQPWDNLTVEGLLQPWPLDRSRMPGFGYCVVFEAEAEAVAWGGVGATIITVRVVAPTPRAVR